MLIAESGDVYIWGSGSDGQLGLGTDNVKQIQPVLLPMDDRVIQVVCGYYHTMLVTGSFKLYLPFIKVSCICSM